MARHRTPAPSAVFVDELYSGGFFQQAEEAEQHVDRIIERLKQLIYNDIGELDFITFNELV